MMCVSAFVIAAFIYVQSGQVEADNTFATYGRADSLDDRMERKRSDGLLHECVNLLVTEKLENMKIKMDEMKKQNKKVLNLFAEWKNKMDKKDAEWKNKLNGVKSSLLREINTKINNGLQTIKNSTVSRYGAVYIRWGRTTCPSKDTKLIYSGYAAGAHYTHQAGTNTQCLPKDPNWRKYQDKWDIAARIYGAEFEIEGYGVGEMLDSHKYHNYDVSCAVCQSLKRSHVLMIPAKDRCYPGWNLEYRGYLMTQRYQFGASEYSCMDAKPDITGSKSNKDGRLFFPVEGSCGSLPCGPYVNGRELTCAVCTF